MTITVMNKGNRTWLPANVRGLTLQLEPKGLTEMEELDALRFMKAYPREIIQATNAAPSSGEIQRQEQSIRDRIANLDKREAELDAREKQIKDREAGLDKKDIEQIEPQGDEPPRVAKPKATPKVEK